MSSDEMPDSRETRRDWPGEPDERQTYFTKPSPGLVSIAIIVSLAVLFVVSILISLRYPILGPRVEQLANQVGEVTKSVINVQADLNAEKAGAVQKATEIENLKRDVSSLAQEVKKSERYDIESSNTQLQMRNGIDAQLQGLDSRVNKLEEIASAPPPVPLPVEESPAEKRARKIAEQIGYLKDNNIEVAKNAALELIKEPEAIPELVKLLGGNPEIRNRAKWCLKWMGEIVLNELIYVGLNNDSEDAQQAAVEVILEKPDLWPVAEEKLWNAQRTGTPRVKVVAVNALYTIASAKRAQMSSIFSSASTTTMVLTPSMPANTTVLMPTEPYTPPSTILPPDYAPPTLFASPVPGTPITRRP